MGTTCDPSTTGAVLAKKPSTQVANAADDIPDAADFVLPNGDREQGTLANADFVPLRQLANWVDPPKFT